MSPRLEKALGAVLGIAGVALILAPIVTITATVLVVGWRVIFG